MNCLRENLIKIAREKIQKSQEKKIVKPRANKTRKVSLKKKSSPRVETSKLNEISSRKNYFPKEPIGVFGYSRPREARLPTKTEQAIKEQFLIELEELNRTKKFKFEDFLKEGNRSLDKKSEHSKNPANK